jgi:hypothetical protein
VLGDQVLRRLELAKHFGQRRRRMALQLRVMAAARPTR